MPLGSWMGVGRGPLGSRAPKALTLDTLLELPCETTVKPVVPAGSWNWSFVPTACDPSGSVEPMAGGVGA